MACVPDTNWMRITAASAPITSAMICAQYSNPQFGMCHPCIQQGPCAYYASMHPDCKMQGPSCTLHFTVYCEPRVCMHPQSTNV